MENEDVKVEPWPELKPTKALPIYCLFLWRKTSGDLSDLQPFAAGVLVLRPSSSHPLPVLWLRLRLSYRRLTPDLSNTPPLCSTSAFPRHIPLNPSSTRLSGSDPLIKLRVLMTPPHGWFTRQPQQNIASLHILFSHSLLSFFSLPVNERQHCGWCHQLPYSGLSVVVSVCLRWLG